MFSSTNHSPFDFPDGKISHYNQPVKTRENAAKYSDYTIGQFFKLAKSSDYWENTIFIIIADHDSRAYGNQLVPIDHFHIPAVIVGKDIPSKQGERLVSQIDVPPTLLSLIGINSINPMIGHDLTQSTENSKLRAMMQFYKNFAWMDNDNNVVIFQPHKVPMNFKYNSITKDLDEGAANEKLTQTAKANANANALWGSIAYRKDYYSSKEIK